MDSETTDTVEAVTNLSCKIRRRYSSPNETSLVVKRQSVSYLIYLKWRGELGKECQTLSWLGCDYIGKRMRRVVEKLKCSVCIRYISHE